MKKIYTLIFLIIFSFASAPVFSQYFQLYFQNFETGLNTYKLNDSSLTNPPFGINKWIKNNVYNGLGIYPYTPREDSTYGGQIGGAPFSYYLHIIDSGNGIAQNIHNCSYDPTVASDNFVIVDVNGVCTTGFDSVFFSFFYTCMGSPTAYGELYYSRNSGPWTQVGLAQYNNKTKWKYEVLSNPAFNDAANLRFGFRWINNSSSDPVTTAMGLDDIQIVGYYDSVSAPVAVHLTVAPNPVCVGQYLIMSYNITDSICDTQFDIEMSDFNGDFSSPVDLGVFNNNYPQTSGAFALYIPSATFPGNCYRIRLRRITPTSPPMQLDTTVCISIIQCPHTITTCPLGPPVVAMDTNAICAGSVIDVPFYSTGAYTTLNYYKIQISDVNGNFVPPDSSAALFIGSMQSQVTYDPANPTPGYPPPGSVSGHIPDTLSAGCNYYLRVIATFPTNGPAPVIGTPWGPHCIQHCDFMTNNEIDMGLCLIPTTDTVCFDIPIHINFYDSSATAITYLAGNEFKIQVISMGPSPPPFTQVGLLGGLGSVTAINDTTLRACIGPLSAILAAGIPPGAYYMRIVATNSSNYENSLGSIIHLTIGAPADIPPLIAITDFLTGLPITHACAGDIVSFRVANPNPTSSYQWSGAFQGSPDTRPYYQPMLIIFGNGATFTITVRENNFGCFGGSRSATIRVFGHPNVNIIGIPTVCLGDTVPFHTVFQDSTFFQWSVNSSHAFITDTANNNIRMTFDSVGTYQVSVYALNNCFDSTGTRTITVIPYPTVNVGNDTSICTGTPITLFNSTTENPVWTYVWTPGNFTNDSITVTPLVSTNYVLSIINQLNGKQCIRKDTVHVTVDQPPQTTFADSICVGGTLLLDPGVNPATYQWATGETTQQITVHDTGTYSVNIYVPGEVCNRIYTYSLQVLSPDSTPRANIICDDQSVLLVPQSAGSMYSYTWSTGDTTNTITVNSAGIYTVVVLNSSLRCPSVETFNITANPNDCSSEYNLPNVFSPDNSGANDFFHPCDNTTVAEQQLHCPPYRNIKDIDLKIYNRWGEIVYQTTDRDIKWNGKKDNTGTDCPDGVYYYTGVVNYLNTINGVSSKPLHGFITILRKKK